MLANVMLSSENIHRSATALLCCNESHSGCCHSDLQVDGTHTSLAQILQPHTVQPQVYMYYVWCKGSSMLKHILYEDGLSYYMPSFSLLWDTCGGCDEINLKEW